MPESRDDEEWRKRLTTVLKGGPAVAYFGNLTRSLSSGALAEAMTARIWEDRPLGANEKLSVPVRCAWFFTANNPTFSTEVARRLVRIRLDPKVDRPWTRDPGRFKHEHLRGWVAAHRAELLWALLTLVRAWLAAGRPEGAARPVLGSYERWAAVMGGILETAGVPGFLENLEEFYEQADAEGAVWRAFVAAWWDKHGAKPVGTAELFPLAAEVDGFDPGRGKNEQAQRTAFGMALARMRDRVIGAYRVEAVDGEKKGARRWRLTEAGEPR